MIGRVRDALVLSNTERAFLEAKAGLCDTAKSVSNRCRIILLCADGLPTKEIAVQLRVHEHTVRTWRRRFIKDRIEGLADECRTGRGRTISDAKIAEVIKRTLQPMTKEKRPWSSRALAAKTGVSHTTIRRIWAEFQLQPHRSESSKLSIEALLDDKLHDIFALFLSPLNQAIILSLTEKPRIQSLEREQPKLPIATDRTELRRTYIRKGISSLCAALDVVTKTPIKRDFRRHEAANFLDFLDQIDRRLPDCQEVHIVMDNFTVRSNPKIKEWLSHRAHWRFHFMPSSPSWINYVERWLAELTCKQSERTGDLSVTDLEADIATFIDASSESPKPYKWVKPPL